MKADKTQPIWLIEEKVRSIRTRTWLRPSTLPTNNELKIAKKISFTLKKEKKSEVSKIKSGLSFCNVSKINKTPQLKGSTILGTQAWKGAAPSLINKANRNNRLNMAPAVLKSGEMTKLSRRITEARAWVRKYLIATSLNPFEFLFNNRGIKANVLISNPTQHKTKEEEENTNSILKKITSKNSKLEGTNQIREEIYSIVGAWAQKLNLAYLSL